MTNTPTNGELVRTLRLLANTDQSKVTSEYLKLAADRIEHLANPEMGIYRQLQREIVRD